MRDRHAPLKPTRWECTALVYLAATSLVIGVWALFFPDGFFGSFPGCGRAWVLPDGAYNEHLVRDAGGLNLGFGVLALIALRRPALASPFAVGLSTLFYNVPHLMYHLTTLPLYTLVDQVLEIMALSGSMLASTALLVRRARTLPAPRSRAVAGSDR